jgi:hypothetical protein
MTTARDIIYSCLEDIGVLGVGQTPLAEDINGAFVRLNRMIGQWNSKRWLIYHLVEGICPTNGNNFVTVGPGGNIDVPARPDRLEIGNFVRQLNGMAPTQDGNGDFNGDFNNDFGPNGQFPSSPGPIDYPLELIEARETYNLICMKFLGSWPSYVFYDAATPLGRAYIYPVPFPNQFNVHLLFKDTLQKFAGLDDEISLPDSYLEALQYNLDIRLYGKYQIDPDDVIVGLAKASLATIRSVNAQVPLLQLDPDLTRGYRYNIFSDQSS